MTTPDDKTINYLDLDAVSPDREIVVKLKGKEHKLVPATLDDFVANTRKIQSLAAVTDPVDEIQIVSEMLLRAFPSMTKDDLGSLRLDQLKALVDFAQKHNGADDVGDEAKKEAQENPPKAG